MTKKKYTREEWEALHAVKEEPMGSRLTLGLIIMGIGFAIFLMIMVFVAAGKYHFMKDYLNDSTSVLQCWTEEELSALAFHPNATVFSVTRNNSGTFERIRFIREDLCGVRQ